MGTFQRFRGYSRLVYDRFMPKILPLFFATVTLLSVDLGARADNVSLAKWSGPGHHPTRSWLRAHARPAVEPQWSRSATLNTNPLLFVSTRASYFWDSNRSDTYTNLRLGSNLNPPLTAYNAYLSQGYHFALSSPLSLDLEAGAGLGIIPGGFTQVRFFTLVAQLNLGL